MKLNEFLAVNPEIKKAFQVIKKVLDEGLTPMQGEDALFDFDLTSYQVGLIVMGITKYHNRGFEFREYWVKRNNLPKNSGLRDETELIVQFPISKRKR